MIHYDTNLIEVLSTLMLITSFVAVESQNLRWSAGAYFIQALLICGLILAFAVGNSALYVWAGTAFATKALLIPFLLLRYIKRTGDQEVKAIIGFVPSVLVASGVVMIFYKLTTTYVHLLAPTPEAAQEPFRTNLAYALSVFVLGIYCILSRRDAIKTVIGLCLLENAAHLSLVSLAPGLRETALIGIATEVVVTVYLLLYVIAAIRKRFGTTDTYALSELHW